MAPLGPQDSTYALDKSARFVGTGRVLIGGSPLKIFRLTDAGAAMIQRIRNGESMITNPLIERLVDAGVLHPHRSGTLTALDVTVVIPAYNTPRPTLERLVRQVGLARQIIIVDDASTPAIRQVSGAQVLRVPHNLGPGGARMVGAAQTTTEVVAFVDTDIELSPDWLGPLLGHFADPRVGAVAPRIASVAGDSVLHRYEASRSPLDLGTAPARVQSGTRVSYVPSAVMLCRCAALQSVGGFRATMRIGEDVDLVWRLAAHGARVRYEPTVTTHHHPRPSVWRWCRQRFDYGTSAASLAEHHRHALAPVRIDRWSAAAWGLIAIGRPHAGIGVAVASTAMLARKLRAVPDGPRLALRLAGLGHLYAGRSIASALVRVWWPVTAMAMLVSPRARRIAAVAAAVPYLIDWRTEDSKLDPVRYAGLRLLDDVSYGTGVWVGCWQRRSAAALSPSFSRAEPAEPVTPGR